jgi:hypothetical protein
MITYFFLAFVRLLFPLQQLFLVLLCTWIVNFPSFAFAQDVSIDLSITQREMSEQESTNINVSIKGNFSSTPSIIEPNWYEQGWDVSSRSQSTSISIINGKRDLVIAYRYRIRPLKQGVLKLGPFQTQFNGNLISSNEESITVTAGPPKAQAGEKGVNQLAFMRWEISENELFLGQAVTVKLMVYVNQQLRLSYFKPTEINLEGFWSQSLDDDQQQRSPYVKINGMNYQQQEAASYILFPLKAGELALPQVQAEMRIARMSFFSEEEEILRIAEAKPIKVKALPTGAPTTFKGLTVGKVVLQAAIDRNRLNADESFQYTLTTQIEGLLANTPPFEMPQIDGFKIFTPSEKTQTRVQNQRLITVRQQTWLIKPSKGGSLTFPPIQISYFDPQLAQYQTATTRDFKIEVTGIPVAQTPQSLNNPSNPSNPSNPLSQSQPSDQMPISTGLVSLKAIKTELSQPSQKRQSSWLFLIFIAAIGPSLLLFTVVRQRLSAWEAQNPGLKKAKYAYQSAKEKLSIYQAQVKAQANESASQISISSILITYLEDKYQIKLKGATYDKYRDILKDLMDAKTIEDLISQLTQEDFRRYSSERLGTEALSQQIKEIEAILTKLEGQK